MSWTLPELIDIPNLQMLMDRFYAATGIPVGIIGKGGDIFVATGWQEICTDFHRTHPVTAERCRQSDDYIKTRLSSGNYVQYKCRNGLWDLAKPLVIAGEHVATLFLGQFFYDDEEIDETFFRGQAREFGFDVDRYMATLKRIPIFTREQVRRIMDFYASFVDFLAQTGLASCRQKETEIKLRESEEKFSKAFHSAPSVFAITTLADGRFVEVNGAFEKLLGYHRDEIIGRSSLDIGIWASQEERQRMVAMVEEHGSVHDMEVALRDKTGKLLVELYSAEIIDLGGERLLLSMHNDITARKRAEEEIEALNTNLASHAAELEAANRELEAFNYTVSHDLRSPLANIASCSQVIQHLCQDVLDEQCLSLLRNVHDETMRMNGLIDALLNFSRLTQCNLNRSIVNLSDLAREISAQLQMNEPDRRVVFSIATGMTDFADPRLIRVVLENLIGNAWKYTGGRETAQIECGVTEISGRRTYFVRDNGPGFAMVDADRLFLPFQRLSATTAIAGHGIGLATAQRVIKRHGGRVWAEGEEGKGATFYFTLGDESAER